MMKRKNQEHVPMLKVRIPLTSYSFLQSVSKDTNRPLERIIGEAVRFYSRVRGGGLDVLPSDDDGGNQNLVTIDFPMTPEADALVVRIIDDSFFSTPSSVIRAALALYEHHYSSQGISYTPGGAYA